MRICRGDYINIKSLLVHWELYRLASIGNGQSQLISCKDGNRFSDEKFNWYDLTDELSNYFKEREYQYKVYPQSDVTVEITINKNYSSDLDEGEIIQQFPAIWEPLRNAFKLSDDGVAELRYHEADNHIHIDIWVCGVPVMHTYGTDGSFISSYNSEVDE